MIPLVAIAGTINAIVSLIIAGRLYWSYRKTRTMSQGHFMLFYLYFGVFYLYFNTSQLFLIHDDGTTIGIFHVVSYFFLYFSLGYLLSFPLILNEKEPLAQQALVAAVLFASCILAVRISYFSPSVREIIGGHYLYWRPVFPGWIRLGTGIFALIAGGYASLFLIIQGWYSRANKFVLYRSLWLGSGIAILVMAAALTFIVAPSGSFPIVSSANMVVLVGLLIIMRGVYFRKYDVTESSE